MRTFVLAGLTFDFAFESIDTEFYQYACPTYRTEQIDTHIEWMSHWRNEAVDEARSRGVQVRISEGSRKCEVGYYQPVIILKVRKQK